MKIRSGLVSQIAETSLWRLTRFGLSSFQNFIFRSYFSTNNYATANLRFCREKIFKTHFRCKKNTVITVKWGELVRMRI